MCDCICRSECVYECEIVSNIFTIVSNWWLLKEKKMNWGTKNEHMPLKMYFR